MQVALVTVGDELLAGDTENTNATWLARRLTERGVTVTRILTIPDEHDLIARTVAEYADAFDAVVVTGGLGGTPDDVTMPAVAAAFNRDLAVDDLALADVRETVAAYREANPEVDAAVDERAEASVPAGSRPLLNEAGLSPGCVLESADGTATVYVLPGIPREMEAMFESVAGEFAGEARSRSVYTSRPESDLVGTLEGVRDRFDVTVGCYPNREAGRNRIKLTATDDDRLEEAVAWLEARVPLVDPSSAERDADEPA